MWESLAIRRLGVPESVGSNPTILTHTPVAQRQRRLPDVEKIAGSSPAGGTLLRSGLEPGFQHGLISRPTPVQIRPPQLSWAAGQTVRRRSCKAEIGVRFPGGPLLLLRSVKGEIMATRQWSPDIIEIGDQIVALTIAQAAMLSEYLEKLHGIKADASPVLPPPTPDVIVLPLEPTEFNVVLEGYEAAKKIGVIRAVREIKGIGLKEASDFVNAVPKVIKDRLPKADAEKLKAQLEAAGAMVSVKAAIG
jgi:large subunit ribosomal protein L7/L12